ncbi:MAG: methanethiol S-methyltransferase [Acidobacteriota bacterium]
MARMAAFVYGAVAYVVFLLAFVYAIGFVGNLFVPKTIDSGAEGDLVTSIVINVLLLGAFAIQHSVMARPGFKKAWTKIVPESVERSTFVLLASLLLIVLYWQWRPMTGVIWSVENQVGNLILQALFWIGWLQVLLSTYLIDHFDLFGLRQVWLFATGKGYTPPVFMERSLYRFMRHPLLLGFMIAFWSTPRMTQGHLLFAAVTTIYMLVAIQLEEHDLETFHGDEYKDYQRRVSMLIPWPPSKVR